MVPNPFLARLHIVYINFLDAIWQTTVEWKGGEVLCRITNVLKQFSMYISSAIIVVSFYFLLQVLLNQYETAEYLGSC